MAGPRETELLNDGWRFQAGDPTNAQAAGFDDRGWSSLSVPHCWGWEEAQQGEKYQRGPGWYRRALNPGQPAEGKRYFVRFEAAGSMAEVYLNGNLLGEHRGAFGAFCFEITKEMSATGTNLLAVRVSNAPDPDIAPLSGDFPVYGGLYRPAHLIVTGAENFDLTDHGSPGAAWLQTSVTEKQATLDVNAEISNGTQQKQPRTLIARVLDDRGNEVAAVTNEIFLSPSATEPFHLQVVVNQPHLWNGRLDPYLYRAIVELRSPAGVVDSVEQPLGLRFYSVDPDQGFFLNGQPYHLHGVNRHQERPDKGWAITEADMDEDLALIQEIGATVVRCCHYQHSDYFYSLCDRAGILVWAEIPQVDRIGADPKFEENSQSQLRDLIRQNLNHPAIFTWSLFNELRPKNPDPHRELQDLAIVAHGEDPTRPVIGATCTPDLPEMNKLPDLLGWNVYYGWYSDWGPLSEFDSMRATYRHTSRAGGYCVSEYGAGANVTQHEDNPRKPKNDGPWHPEEYQAIYHEAAWPQLQAAPYIWGTFVWNMFDFTSFWRHEGGVPGRNDKGLVTADRKVKKDAFYYYKANWSAEPTLYLTSRRFTERTNAVTSVKVYANTASAELFINGASQGVRQAGAYHVIVWPGRTLVPGKNQIEVQAVRAGQTLRDACEWTLRTSEN